MNPPGMVTALEASEILGVTKDQVLKLVRDKKKLPGDKVDGQWFVERDAVLERRDRLAATSRQAGPTSAGRHDELEFAQREIRSLELELMRRERDDALRRLAEQEAKMAALRPLVDQLVAQLLGPSSP